MLPALIGAGASLLGSLLSSKSADKANKMQAQQAAQNRADQYKFAQDAIKWKVKDAKQAGIHPLYALGANTVSFSPISVGSTVPDWSGIGNAGQQLGQAFDQGRNGTQKITKIQALTENLSLERGALENELLRAQIRKLSANTPSVPGADPMLIDGQPSTAVPGTLIDENPMKRQASAPGSPHTEAGAVADVGYARTKTGWAPVPSMDVKNRIEDMLPAELSWMLRNMVAPSVGFNNTPPPNVPLADGMMWAYNPAYQEYHQVPDFRKRFRERYSPW